MIESRTGDILQSDTEALVNTVNCVGVMGRGIALQFKKAYPANFREYAAACARGEVEPGRMLVHEVGVFLPRLVIDFPTKRHWKGRSRLEDIRSGLIALVEVVRERGVGSIAIPPLGCGLGGLDWAVVRPLIEAAFAPLPEVRVVLYEPAGAPPAASMAKTVAPPRMTQGRAALLGLMRGYLRAAMDPDVSLLEIHKLMYFLQEAGEDLKLQFQKAPYGPYAENLRHVLNAIEGHYVVGYGDGEDDPRKTIEHLPGSLERADEFLEQHTPTKERFARVLRLIEGFETPNGMELLATVHWVMSRERESTASGVTERIHAWNDRKKRFLQGEIEIAMSTLRSQEWVGAD